MIKKRSDLFTLLLLLLFPLARLFIPSFPSFILSNLPLFLPLPPLPLGLLSVTCPTMRSFHLRLHVHVHTPYDTKKASAQVHTYCTVPYMYLTCPYIHHTTQKGLPSPSSSGR